MNYLKIDKASVADGPGVRVVLWVSGCTMRCNGCHNQESWDFNAGTKFDRAAMDELLEALRKPYIQGITFSGGHPLEPENLECVNGIIEEIRKKLPEKDIWLYTGFCLSNDDFGRDWNVFHIFETTVSNCDFIVDGPYIEDLRDISLQFRGSSNQRIIDVKKTIKYGEIVTIQEDDSVKE